MHSFGVWILSTDMAMARDIVPTVYMYMFIYYAMLDFGHFTTSSEVKIEMDSTVSNGDVTTEYIHSMDHYQGKH